LNLFDIGGIDPDVSGAKSVGCTPRDYGDRPFKGVVARLLILALVCFRCLLPRMFARSHLKPSGDLTVFYLLPQEKVL
jgi:hypothetical protein